MKNNVRFINPIKNIINKWVIFSLSKNKNPSEEAIKLKIKITSNIPDIKGYYEERYGTGLEELGFNDRRRVRVFSSWIGKNKKVLEISGGDVMPFRFYDKTNKIYLVDISENVLKRSKPYVYQTRVLNIDKENLPFKSNFFDVVVAGEIIEHLFFPNHFLNESFRVLKRSGLFIGSTPNAFNWRRRIEALLGYQSNDPINGEHIRFFNLSYLKRLLKKYFKNIYITTYSPIKFPLGIIASSFLWKCKK